MICVIDCLVDYFHYRVLTKSTLFVYDINGKRSKIANGKQAQDLSAMLRTYSSLNRRDFHLEAFQVGSICSRMQ